MSDKEVTKVKKIINNISKPVKELLGFDKVIIRYMAMHWIGGLLLIYSTLLPVFMNKLNITIINAGAIFSMAAFLDVVLTYILSKYLDKISPNLGMALDWWTESIPPLVFSFATSAFQLFMGIFARGITNILNPVYKIYENEIFPEGQRSLIYTYHLMTPELFSIIFYPLIGYLLTYVFPSLQAFRLFFAICGLAYLGVGFIPLKDLKWVEPTVLPDNKISIKIPKELYLVALAQIFVTLGLGFTSTLITSYYVLDKLNGDIMTIVLLEVIGSFVIIVTGLCTKELGKICSDEKVAQYGVGFFLVFSFLMIFGKSYLSVIMAFIFRAVGNTIWFPYHHSILMKLVPKENRGEFFGGISSLSKLLGILIPVISGFLAAFFGFFVPFVLTFMSFIAVAAIYQIMLKQQEKTQLEIYQ